MSSGAWIMLLVGASVLYGGLAIVFVKIFQASERKKAHAHHHKKNQVSPS
ncbi:MAG: hypothetical protein J7J85_05460 [Deltaproteobacteria bacterium]|nr:hypothetical protein [Deltaproteobacteria bacterium]